MKYENAVIIAGGKSTRMGKDKALLPFGKCDTLTQFQYAKLEKFFSKVYISTKENKFHFESSLIYDKYEASSPLVAILSIFEALDVNSIFVLSVDTPFVNQKIIERIYMEDRDDIDIIIAKSPSGDQPLCGLYKKSILGHAYSQFKKGNHKLTDLLCLVNTKRVFFEEDNPFMNLNRPEDYKKALKA